ncbi:MAG: hypothetical protein M4579_007088 [Chaenotheca gracillima]|nr:MAG: hypothetical protein M4579_007088 [Chaenotheca gracillima]
MRTSRIARDTAKTLRASTNAAQLSSPTTRRQTRTFAKSLSEYAAVESSNGVKVEPDSDTPESPVSYTTRETATSEVVEDAQISSSRKRKRRTEDTPLTSTTEESRASVKSRSTPRRKTGVAKDEDDGEDTRVSQRAGKLKREQPEVEIHPPPRWRETYETMKEMRKSLIAPVDTMGCERLADSNALPKDQRFQTLLSLMLSSQTRDTTTSATIRKLQAALAPTGGLTVANVRALPAAELNTFIWAVGFHNTKTKNIKAVAEILAEQHDGDIPDTLEGLMALPGVGPKMAYLCLAAAWDRVEGIGVDVHVHRITNLWGWHARGKSGRKTKGPEETRLALQAWLPAELWHEINHLLVGFGQTVCAPQRPKCEECVVGAKGLCPAMNRSARAVVRKKKVQDPDGDGAGALGATIMKEEQEAAMSDMEDLGKGVKLEI